VDFSVDQVMIAYKCSCSGDEPYNPEHYVINYSTLNFLYISLDQTHSQKQIQKFKLGRRYVLWSLVPLHKRQKLKHTNSIPCVYNRFMS
jgi:hypothetical protein